MDLRSERRKEREQNEKTVKKDTWLAALSTANWIAVLIMLPRIPDRIPLHWNIGGGIDNWGGKINLIWLGAVGPALWALMTYLPSIDPGKKNYAKFGGSYRVIRAMLVILMSALVWISVAAASEETLNAVLFIKISLGLVFTVIGNLMMRLRPNWFTGVKTPWTLADPVIWKKTHRLAGYLMTAGGLIFLVSAAFLPGPSGFWIPMIIIVGGAFADIVFSAVLWRKLHGREPVTRPKR